MDSRIVLVEVDGDTFTEVGQPVSRWADDYARLVSILFEQKARVVGLDILFRPELSKLPEPDAAQIYFEVEQLAGIALTQPLVIVDSYQQKSGTSLTSIDILQASAESLGNVGVNNMLTDPDGKVRSLGLFFYDRDPRSIRNFAGRVAELTEGRSIALEDGGVKGLALDSIERMRINFPGPTHQVFPRFKMSRILAGEVPQVEGAVCLIGPTFDTSNDLHNTPLDSGLGSWGLEIHGAALNTMLTGRLLKSSPGWSHFLLTLVAVLGAHLAAKRLPASSLAPVLALAALFYLAFAFLLFSHFSRLVPITAPLAGLLLSGGATAVARYRALESSRRFVQGVLGRFVSPQVMEELLSSPDKLQLGGRRRRITVLFTDINNFTPLCEKRTPEEVIVMLNEFFNEMLEIIFRYNGTVKQFVGDEIMVMYGAPNSMEDHARRAVMTARDMVDRLQELRKQKGDEAGFYEVKVGIHSGEVVVGNVGNEKRSEYAAVGDTVNTAARIEGLTKQLKETILLSQETVDEIGESLPEMEFLDKGPQTFKGKADQMQVYGVRW